MGLVSRRRSHRKAAPRCCGSGRKSGPEGPKKKRAELWVSLKGGAESGMKTGLGRNSYKATVKGRDLGKQGAGLQT